VSGFVGGWIVRTGMASFILALPLYIAFFLAIWLLFPPVPLRI
jgi:hypothetical protein